VFATDPAASHTPGGVLRSLEKQRRHRLRKLASLGYRVETLTDMTYDVGATVVDMSWTAAPCTDASTSDGCVATIRPVGDDVIWVPRPYEIGGLKKSESVERQKQIDGYAKRLGRTLATYDDMLSKTKAIRASFYLVGHSMAGELVVRQPRSGDVVSGIARTPSLSAGDGAMRFRSATS
jgi:hypothetical protein